MPAVDSILVPVRGVTDVAANSTTCIYKMATETSESTAVVFLIGFVFHDNISLLVSAS